MVERVCNFDAEAGKIYIDGIDFSIQGYRILKEIGKGANAEVFLAYNEILDRNEAIKIWLPRKNSIVVNEDQFYSEIRKNAKFTDNPLIATIYSGALKDGFYYCIMEYCPGVTLKTFLSKAPCYFLRWSVARTISAALNDVYHKGYYHGDLHDRNIIIGGRDLIKILDLGTSVLSGSFYSHRRDAELVYNLSMEIIPMLKCLPFYNSKSISDLPSVLINMAFGTALTIVMPSSNKYTYKDGLYSVDKSSSIMSYKEPNLHSLDLDQLALFISNKPIFVLTEIDRFLLDYKYNKDKVEVFHRSLFSYICKSETYNERKMYDEYNKRRESLVLRHSSE